MQNTANCLTDQTWHNWAGNLIAQPQFICTPQSQDELSAIVNNARIAHKTLRVFGGSYSWSPVVPTNDWLVDMSKLNKILYVDTVKQQVKVEAGMPIGQLSLTMAETYGLAFETETVIPYVTVGGAVALGCHGTGYNKRTLSDLVVSMDIVMADGTCRTFTAGETSDDLMNAVRVSLGALGIIYSLTFQCVSLFRLRALDKRAPMEDTINNQLKELVTGHDYAEVFWFPFNKDCWIKTWDKTTDPINEGPIKWGLDELIQFLEISTVGKLLMKWLLNRPFLTPLVMNIFSRLMPQQKVVAEPPLVFHYQTSYLKVWIMGYAIDILNGDFTKVQQAWWQVVNLINTLASQKPAKYPQNMVLHTRYIKSSNAYLSPTVGNDHTCCIEILTFMGDDRPVSEYEDYFKKIEQGWISLSGKPHWGKAIYSVNQVKDMFGPHMDNFLKIREQLDPDQVFVNDFVRQVFQLQPP